MGWSGPLRLSFESPRWPECSESPRVRIASAESRLDLRPHTLRSIEGSVPSRAAHSGNRRRRPPHPRAPGGRVRSSRPQSVRQLRQPARMPKSAPIESDRLSGKLIPNSVEKSRHGLVAKHFRGPCVAPRRSRPIRSVSITGAGFWVRRSTALWRPGSSAGDDKKLIPGASQLLPSANLHLEASSPWVRKLVVFQFVIGGPCRIRTYDPLIKSNPHDLSN